MISLFEAVITILIFVPVCQEKIIIHLNVFMFDLINLAFIFTSLLVIKIMNLISICVCKIPFPRIGIVKSSRHFKTFFCDLSILYHRDMIKSNPTKGGRNVYLAMVNTQ